MSKLQSKPRAAAGLVMMAITGAVCDSTASAQPVTTIITHGYSPDSKGAWVEAMAAAILERSGVGSVYRYVGSGPLGGVWQYVDTPHSDGSADAIVCIFNWVEESAGPAVGPNWNYAQAAGDALYAALRDARYVGQPNTPPRDLTLNRALHFIGHSRGACVNSEAVLRLAREGIEVDHCTALDPHPVNGTLDAPLNFNWNDPTPRRWSNIVFFDNYWRADGGGLNALDFDGIPIDGAFNTMLNESALNCCAYSLAHSDVHLWLHGTIDLAPTACDGEQCINATMRATWWPEGYAERGWFYSILGGGVGQRPGAGPPSDPPPVEYVSNGEFVNASHAGWFAHGGSVAGVIANDSGTTYLRLGAGVGTAPRATHNRLYLPRGVDDVELDTRVFVGATRAPETLRITMTNMIGADFLVAEQPIASVAGPWSLDQRFAVPPSMARDATYTLTFEIISSGVPNAIIGLDNIDLVDVPAIPGDVTGDGCVDIDDLLAVVAAWGPCSPPPAVCSADVALDGEVNIDDLLLVISNWGGC